MNEVKPLNPTTGWHFKRIYIAEDGKVFRRGKYCPEETKESVAEELKVIETEKSSENTPLVSNDKSESPKKEEDLKKLLLEQNKLFAEALSAMAKGNPDQSKFAKDIAEAIKSTTGNINKRVARRIDDIDPKDTLEVPITFTAHSNGYVVNDYYGTNGQIVLPPYGGIFEFKHAGSRKIKTDREEQVQAYCTITIRSQKEAEHLRGHPHYGLAFHENSRSALSVNNTIVQRAAEMWNKIQKWERGQVLSVARTREDMKEKLGMPIAELRTALAVSFAEEIIKQKDEISLKKAKDGLMETLMNKS